MDGLLHRTLAVPASRRTGNDACAVVLGDGDEARLDDAGLRVDDSRHAVDSPTAGISTEAAQHAIHGFDEMGLVFRLGEAPRNFPEHGRDPSSRWASPPQGASGSSSQSHWISSAGGCSISMVALPLHTGARLAVRAQRPGTRRPRVKLG